MKKFELQKLISRLFNVLNSQLFAVDFFQIGSSEQSNKTHEFQKNQFSLDHSSQSN